MAETITEKEALELVKDRDKLAKLGPLTLKKLADALKAIPTLGGRARVPDNPGAFAAQLTKGLRGEWQPARHLMYLSGLLADVESGRLKRLMISLSPRHGKAIDDDALVLTTLGFKRHGTLQAGDMVFNAVGNPVPVLAVGERIEDEAVEVSFDFGSVVCHLNHEWDVESNCKRTACGGGKSRHRHSERLETRNLLRGGRAEAVVVAGPPILPIAELDIDPYLLGLWLGDGNNANSYVTGGRQDFEHMCANFSESKLEKSGCYRYFTPGLKFKLDKLGLLRNKHIPQGYLMASIGQRLALLQGLMDTDGYVSREGQCEFVNTKFELARDFHRLASSLGLKASFCEGRSKLYGKDCGPKYRILFSPPAGFKAFRLARKQGRVDSAKKRPRDWARYVRDIKPVGRRSMRCIQVEGGVYCVGAELIPTHNSELTSFWFLLWALCRDPYRRILFLAATEDLAVQFGRRVRGLVTIYGKDYGLELSQDSTSAKDWKLTTGGGMYSAGRGTAIQGRPADLLVGDDIIPGLDDANSEKIREDTHRWFLADAVSRLEPGAPIILINTRWNQDDLLGRLTASSKSGEGDEYTIVNLPAIAEENDPLGRKPGEALWPERWPIEELNRKRKTVGSSYLWNAIYQGNPIPEEGNSIKRSWWKYYTVTPARFDQVIQSWDLAMINAAANDYTVGQVWGRVGAQFYLLHQVRGKMDAAEQVHAIRNVTELYPYAVAKLIENKANGPAVISMLAHEVSGVIPWPPKGQQMGSKDARRLAVAPVIEAGNVYLPAVSDSPLVKPVWVSEFIEELCGFGAGAPHDDQLDAASQALGYLMHRGYQSINADWSTAKTMTFPQSPAEHSQSRLNEYLGKRILDFTRKAQRRESMVSMRQGRVARSAW